MGLYNWKKSIDKLHGGFDGYGRFLLLMMLMTPPPLLLFILIFSMDQVHVMVQVQRLKPRRPFVEWYLYVSEGAET